MNQQGIICQRLILRQRRRYANDSSVWPGRKESAKAVTLYPNILAELDASGETLEKLAWYAKVSTEIMAAVLEDGEKLTEKEIRRVAFNLKSAKEGYLTARKLQTVDPQTNRGKTLVWRFDDIVRAADGLPIENPRLISSVRDALEKGKPVTYAEYRWASHWLLNAIETEKKTKKKDRRIRTERMT